LSETAFLYSTNEASFKDMTYFSLRWFTPKTEVPLCGHATLATAAVLFLDIKVSASEIAFETKSGRLTAKREGDGILLDFPSHETAYVTPDRDLLRAVGIVDFIDAQFSENTRDLLIRLPNEEILANLDPDFERMKTVLTKDETKGVIVTSKGRSPYDFVSRYFAPWLGINEDPVTGAAHTVLGRIGQEFWEKTKC
jgi:PhzF family phenazine biosynthesis protein